jgi:hypothetical protein
MFNRKHPFFLFLWRKGWVLSQRIPRASSLPTLKVRGSYAPGARGISAAPPIHFNYPDLPRKKGCFLINTITLILKLGLGC